jgi:myosin heavy subunit
MLTKSKDETASAKPLGTAGRGRRFLKGLFGTKPDAATAPPQVRSQATAATGKSLPGQAQQAPAAYATAGGVSDKAAAVLKRPAQKINEVAELVHALRSHIDQQSDRSERLLDKMEGLPAALESLPQSSQNGERMVTTMQRHIDLQQNHSERLVQVIEDMSTASKHRDQTINMLQRQMTASQEKDAKFMSGFQALSRTMSKMGDIQEKSASMLQRIAETASQSEKRMSDVVNSGRRQAWTGLISVGAMAIVLLAMTAYVALSVMRDQASQPTLSNPPVNTQAVSSPPATTVDAALIQVDTPAENDAADARQVEPAISTEASAEADASEPTPDTTADLSVVPPKTISQPTQAPNWAALFEALGESPIATVDELAKIDPSKQAPILSTSP